MYDIEKIFEDNNWFFIIILMHFFLARFLVNIIKESYFKIAQKNFEKIIQQATSPTFI